MYYVLFTYSKGQREKDFVRFRSENDVIEFLHNHYESIDIVQIIAAEKSFSLGLIETEDLIKSELISQDIETDLPDPGIEPTVMEKIIEETKEKAALKIPDEAILEPEEMTDEEIEKKNKELLKRGDKAIAAAKADIKKTRQKFDKSKWKDCPICHKEKVAPWSTKGICSICQRNKKKLKKTEEKI